MKENEFERSATTAERLREAMTLAGKKQLDCPGNWSQSKRLSICLPKR